MNFFFPDASEKVPASPNLVAVRLVTVGWNIFSTINNYMSLFNHLEAKCVIMIYKHAITASDVFVRMGGILSRQNNTQVWTFINVYRRAGTLRRMENGKKTTCLLFISFLQSGL